MWALRAFFQGWHPKGRPAVQLRESRLSATGFRFAGGWSPVRLLTMILDSSSEGTGLPRPGQAAAAGPVLHTGGLRLGQETGFHQATPGPQDPLQAPSSRVCTQKLGPCLLQPLSGQRKVPSDPLPGRGVVRRQAGREPENAFPVGLPGPSLYREPLRATPSFAASQDVRAWCVDAGALGFLLPPRG